MDTLFETGESDFAVVLDVFSGPFSVLLGLITRKKLDITDVALAEVTDEFLEFMAARTDLDLSVTSEFLVVAATLLELKASRLLPHDKDDEEFEELLSQRDLLFAKLLQYKAYKDVAADFEVRLARVGMSHGRDVPLEQAYALAIPETRIDATLVDLAHLAAMAMARAAHEPEVSLTHLHTASVPVAGEVEAIQRELASGPRTFAELCSGHMRPTVVARFLALLELLRNGRISVDQDAALGTLVVRLEHHG